MLCKGGSNRICSGCVVDGTVKGICSGCVVDGTVKGICSGCVVDGVLGREIIAGSGGGSSSEGWRGCRQQWR
jgi:hypothetical protein